MPELIASGQLPLYDYNDAIVAGIAPADPAVDTLWLDNSSEPSMMKRWNGTEWDAVGELDPTYSTTISTIQTTLSNMADDSLLDYTDRQKLKEDISQIIGSVLADAAPAMPTGATLDGGNVGSYRRIRKAAASAGVLPSHTAYTGLANAYNTLSGLLNGYTPKPWDLSEANKSTPSPVDKTAFRNAWLGYYNAEIALSDETTAALAGNISTLKNTTIPALENKALSEAEKSAIQSSLNLISKEKNELDATAASYDTNTNLVDKTIVSVPKAAYDDAYTDLLAAMNDVLDEPTGQVIADTKIAAVNDQFSNYGTKLAALRTGFQDAQKAIEAKIKSNYDNAISTALTSYVDKTSYGLDIAEIQRQVDGSITTWFGSTEPSFSSAPTNEWTTEELKELHVGDLYYDDASGYAYRFSLKDTVYSWVLIQDTDIGEALSLARNAQDTADAKRRAFYAQPVPPYDIGDLWVQGANGDLMRCVTSQPADGGFLAGHWEKAVRYTDDTTVNNLEIGGQNIIPQASIAFYNSTMDSYDADTNTWTLAIANNTSRGGFSFTGQNIRIPYGRTYLMSFEVQAPYAATFAWDVNNYPVGATAWNGNDNDNGPLRKNSATAVAANQWVKCWYLFTNTHTSNTSKVDLYDGSNFGINNNTGSTQLVKFRNIKGEFGNRPTEWQPSLVDLSTTINKARTDAQGYAENYISENVQPQIDGKIESHAQASDPSTAWTDAATKTVHAGDIWYNTTSKQTKRWSGTAWVTLEDVVANNAAALAATKNKIFTATPTVPYKAGDFWINNQELYVSSQTRDSGEYVAGDWTKAVKYTDDAAAQAAQQAADNAKGRLDDIISDNKLTAVEKQAARNEWNALVSEVALYTSQAAIFSVSATDYQTAFANLGTYLNSGTTLTYTQLTSGGSIPLWIQDSKLSETTTIVGADYRSGWKAFYDARVALLNAIASKNKDLADDAQTSVDNLVVDGNNWIDNSDFSKTLDTSGEQGYTSRGGVTLAIQSGIHPDKNALVATFLSAGVSGSVDVVFTLNETIATPIGESFALSFEAKATAATSFSVRGSGWNSSIQTKALTTDWARYTFLLPVQALSTTKTLVFWLTAPAALHMTKIKFERGTKATAWSPSIRDVSAVIATAQSAAEGAQSVANTARDNITDIISDNKLTGNEKTKARLDWDTLASEAVANSTQAGTFGISVTDYQKAVADLGTYLNGGTTLTYAQCTGGTIPLWITDANIGTTTTITGSIYRSTWKTYYDKQVALLNAIALKARELATTAQQTADKIQVGGRNVIPKTNISLYGVGAFVTNGSGISVSETELYLGRPTIKIDCTTNVNGILYNGYVLLKRNTTYTYSMMMKSSTAVAMTSGSPLHMWTAESGMSAHLETIVSYSHTTIPANTWTKVSITFKTPNVVEQYYWRPFVYQGFTVGTIVYVCDMQCEVGNRPSDWLPAPEDVTQEISEVQNFADSLQDLTNTMFKDGLIETAEASAIQQHLNSLANENLDVLNQYTIVYGNANLSGTPKTELFTAKDAYVADYDNLVSAINTAIADNKTTTAEKTAVDNAFASYRDKLKALNEKLTNAQTAIANKLATDAANNIQVGGRNWFKKTTNISNLGGTTSTVKNTLNGFTTTVSAANSSIRIANVFNENSTYTFSGYITSTVSGTVQVDFADNAFGSFSVSTTRAKFSVTGTISNYTVGTYHFIDLSGLPAGTYTFEDVKVEKGNKATDWTPAPEDVDSKIAASVAATDVEYYLSTSNTELLDGSWMTNAPAWTDGKFMWSRTKITLNSGTVSYSPSANGTCISGAQGPVGLTGNTGIGISSVVEQYYLSTSDSSTVDGSWGSDMPTWTEGTYIWTRSQITWTDTNVTTSTPALANAINSANEQALAAAREAQRLTPFIQGTQTASTNSWTGVAPFPTLVDGQQITYWLPFSATSNVTLNLTLLGGATTGAKNCYYGGNSPLTTHYSAGNAIRLTYRSSVNIGGTNYTGWWADANYDSNNTNLLRYQQNMTAKTAITSGRIIVALDQTGFYHLVANTSFSLALPVLWAGSSISAASSGNNNYTMYPDCDLDNNIAGLPAFTVGKTIYIKGTLNGLVFTTHVTGASVFTETPLDDGYVYMALGQVFTTGNRILLYNQHELYMFDKGVLKSFSQIAAEANTKISNLKIGGTNLLARTSDFYLTSNAPNLNGWFRGGTWTTTQLGSYTKITASATGNASNVWWGYYSSKIPLAELTTTTITIQFEYLVDSVAAWDVQSPVILELYDSTNTRIGWRDTAHDFQGNLLPTSGLWQRFVCTVDVSAIPSISYTSGKTYADATYFSLRLALARNGTISFRKAKIETGNLVSDWSTAPEDASALVAASNETLNSLRQSLDSQKDIRLGMKLGFSTFSTPNPNYVYFCGLTTNATSFAEEISDTNGSLYDRGTQTMLEIPKQALNLSGLTEGTNGYLVWNSSDGTNKIWFITLKNTYDASGTMTSSRWMKRNVGVADDNTEMVLTDAVYVLGELEI